MNDFYNRFLNSNKYLRWKGFSDKVRDGAIKEIEEVVNKFGRISDVARVPHPELAPGGW